MSEKKITEVEIYLPMFKQGDDLACHLENAASPAEAFECHAEQMTAVAEQLRGIAAAIRETESDDAGATKVFADTHYIALSGPPALMSRLLEEELASKIPEELLEEDEDLDDDEGEE